jgi:transcriptional regulator NrdR family protein
MKLSTSILPRCMTICSHMKCPFCLQKTRIYNSRASHQNTQTWRRHKCTACSSTFTTREKIDWSGATIVRTETEVAPYDRDRLLLSIARSAAGYTLQPSMISELTDSVELELQACQFFKKTTGDAAQITEATTAILHRLDPYLSVQYINHVHKNKPPLDLVKKLLG